VRDLLSNPERLGLRADQSTAHVGSSESLARPTGGESIRLNQ
jgi:hypothetical protein